MPAEPSTVRQEWTEPGAFAVAPGVHRIPLPLPSDGLRAVNVYAIEDGDSLVLVDGGWALAESRQVLAKALGEIGCEPGDIRQIFVTHVHRDHYTQAIQLRREFGARVSLGSGERDSIDLILGRSAHPVGPQLTGLRASGAWPVLERLRALFDSSERDRERDGAGRDGAGRGSAEPAPPDGATWEAPDQWLAHDQEIELRNRSLRVLATPGHTQGHVVFADLAAGLLFAGDHVLPHITPSIGFEPVESRQPLANYLGSLRLMQALPDLRLLPAHGPVAASVHARVDELLAHHAGRLDRSAAAVGGGPATAYQVATRLRWTRRERTLDDLDPFNQMLAVTETRAHLELLVAQGRLAAQQDGEVTYYAPAAPSGPAGAGDARPGATG
ncbi:MAG: MBL fold metallo-hydrolase [Nocardiopsaceae bacterium]|nr:MBL fold metallo-hydrolase [Nocardiopsaceae bacterium]